MGDIGMKTNIIKNKPLSMLIECDFCNYYYEYDIQTYTYQKTKSYLEKLGWVNNDYGEYFCPDCSKKFNLKGCKK